MLRSLMRTIHGPIYRSRMRELVRLILPELEQGDRVLDVGCGAGALGRAILEAPTCPADVEVRGLERARRGGEAIEVVEYDGRTIPFEDNAFDVVLLADVLHHEPDADRLVSECIRIARRMLIVKDHQKQGVLAQQRIAFLDWAANAPYGVPCLYEYLSPAGWRAFGERDGLRLRRELTSIDLYPPVFNLVFGRRLQYMAFYET